MLEKAEGTVKEFAGKVQDAIGRVTDDPSTRLEGQARQVAGKVEQSYGEVLDQVRESALLHPVATVTAIAGVGFLLGLLLARR